MDKFDMYIVKAGDTLYNLAKKYETTWQDLMKMNNMTSTLLRIGKQLIVPGNANKIEYYVEAGDTLFSIAEKFKMDMDELKQKNNLNTDDVTLGQLLKIK